MEQKLFYKYRSQRDFQNHTHISFKNRYVYFGVAKAANSTIKYYLQSLEYINSPHQVKNVHHKGFSPLLSPFQLDKQELSLALFSDKYKRFTLVRNPFERLLSCFLDRVQDTKSASYKLLQNQMAVDPLDISFNEFVEFVGSQEIKKMDCHWRPQSYEIYNDIITYDDILRFEDLPENIRFLQGLTNQGLSNSIAEKILSENINMSPSNTFAFSKVSEYYNNHIKDMVRKIYAEDFHAFDYDLEI